MDCGCCGKKKKLFEMFYSVGEEDEKISICRDCWDVVERLELDAAGGEKELYEIHLFQCSSSESGRKIPPRNLCHGRAPIFRKNKGLTLRGYPAAPGGKKEITGNDEQNHCLFGIPCYLFPLA